MSLKDRIQEDMKAAMRSGDKERLGTIRLILAAIKQREVDDRREQTDPDVVAILDKMAKQRNESISQFEKGHRSDLADAERAELAILRSYMPQALSIGTAIAKVGATGASAMGKVMAELRGVLAGRADMARVSAKVKARLAG